MKLPSERLVRVVLVLSIMPWLVIAGASTFIEKVPIDRVGVKTLQLGGGVEQRDFAPGYVFVLPGMHKLELMDPTYQLLTQSGSSAVELRSSDGFRTEVDITIVYRLKPGMAHKAIARHGPGYKFREKLQTIAEKYVWEVMGELVTEDFYNSEKRTAQAEKARVLMQQQLDAEFIEVIDVLLRDIRYDQRFEQLLLSQQLLDQEKLLFDSQNLLARERTKTELIQRKTENMVIEIKETQLKAIRELVADTDAAIARIQADAERFAETAIAEASREARQAIAEGELARTRARADGDKAINAAYSQPGGELLLTRKMIENLSFGQVELNTTQTNPFDVEQLLRMLGLGLETRMEIPSPAAPPQAVEGASQE